MRSTIIRADGYTEVTNPIILDIDIGNMIRVREPGREEWGNMVVDVNYRDNLVLVRTSMGGTMQRDEWAHIDSVHITWNIGGRERAEQRFREFQDAALSLCR